jgi:F0F1-type ATP synthase assembly protein I
MTVCQGFLLGLMAAWIPSLIFVGCIVLGSSPEDSRRQSDLTTSPQ